MSGNNKLDNGTDVIGGLAENLLSNVEGIFSVKPMAKYLSGARCIIRVNGDIAAFAFAVSWNIKTSVEEINTIDDYMPYELAPKRIQVDGTISGFRIPGDGPSKNLIHTDILSFLHQRYIDIEVRDSQTDNIIFATNRAMIVGRSENVRSEALADMTLQFRAIGWTDERDPKQPEGVGGRVDTTGTGIFQRTSDNLRNLL